MPLYLRWRQDALWGKRGGDEWKQCNALKSLSAAFMCALS